MGHARIYAGSTSKKLLPGASGGVVSYLSRHCDRTDRYADRTADAYALFEIIEITFLEGRVYRLENDMNTALCVLLVLIATPTSARYNASRQIPPATATVARAASDSVVRLFVRGVDGVLVPSGSGTVVARDVVVSTRRPLRDGRSVYVKQSSSTLLIPAAQLPPVLGSDVDVFRVSGLAAPPVGPVDRIAIRGEGVTSLGAAGLGPATATGIITRLSFAQGETALIAPERPWLIACDVNVTSENAGGVLLGNDGAVLGMSTGTFSLNAEHSFVVPIETVHDVVRTALSNATPSVDGRTNALPEIDRASEASGHALKFPIEAVPAGIDSDLGRLGDPTGRTGPEADGPAKGGNYGSGKGGNYGSGSSGPASKDARSTGAEIVTKPRVVSKGEVRLTQRALDNGTGGTVVVHGRVRVDGTLVDATIRQGLPDGLNQEALRAVGELKFEPARNAAGQPVESPLSVEVPFNNPNRTSARFWTGRFDGTNERVHVFLATNSRGEARGFLLVEAERNVVEYVQLEGTMASCIFKLRATERGRNCTTEWLGRCNDATLSAREVRTCADNSAATARDLTALRLSWNTDDAGLRQ